MSPGVIDAFMPLHKCARQVYVDKLYWKIANIVAGWDVGSNEKDDRRGRSKRADVSTTVTGSSVALLRCVAVIYASSTNTALYCVYMLILHVRLCRRIYTDCPPFWPPTQRWSSFSGHCWDLDTALAAQPVGLMVFKLRDCDTCVNITLQHYSTGRNYRSTLISWHTLFKIIAVISNLYLSHQCYLNISQNEFN